MDFVTENCFYFTLHGWNVQGGRDERGGFRIEGVTERGWIWYNIPIQADKVWVCKNIAGYGGKICAQRLEEQSENKK